MSTKSSDETETNLKNEKPKKVNKFVALRKTELCKDYMKGICRRKKEECAYAHGPDDLRSVSLEDKAKMRLVPSAKKWRTELCDCFYRTGHCRFGAKCAFIHDDPTGEDQLSSYMSNLSLAKGASPYFPPNYSAPSTPPAQEFGPYQYRSMSSPTDSEEFYFPKGAVQASSPSSTPVPQAVPIDSYYPHSPGIDEFYYQSPSVSPPIPGPETEIDYYQPNPNYFTQAVPQHPYDTEATNNKEEYYPNDYFFYYPRSTSIDTATYIAQGRTVFPTGSFDIATNDLVMDKPFSKVISPPIEKVSSQSI